MSKTVLFSFFRDCAGRQVTRYMDQAAALAKLTPLRVVAIHGDCADDTPMQLVREGKKRGLDCVVTEASHGRGKFGSTEDPRRMEALSIMFNRGLEAVVACSREFDTVLFVESDLAWKAETMTKLVAALEESDADAVAPLVFAGAAFYDIWGYRGLDGERFSPFAPFHPSLASLDEHGMVEVSSVGSCFAMENWVARSTRIENGNAIVGFWEAARRDGRHSVYVKPDLKVDHPC